MSTKIPWCTETLNPFFGCTKVSPGCNSCYAEVMAKRLKGMGQSNYREVIENGHWSGDFNYDPDVMVKAYKWKKPRMIFVNSMSDTFHEYFSRQWILQIMNVVAMNPQHTFLILTKRAERMYGYFEGLEISSPLPNLWLGVTVENQEQANERVPYLLATPAAKRFVSVEPMLGKIDLINVWDHHYRLFSLKQLGFIDWVICGGESGPKARPMHPEWVRFLQIQCKVASTPFFFKQWGEWLPSYDFGARLDEFTERFPGDRILRRKHVFEDGQVMYRVGKKAAGAMLDGQLYKEYPNI